MLVRPSRTLDPAGAVIHDAVPLLPYQSGEVLAEDLDTDVDGHWLSATG
jgi:hypothetical protein